MLVLARTVKITTYLVELALILSHSVCTNKSFRTIAILRLFGDFVKWQLFANKHRKDDIEKSISAQQLIIKSTEGEKDLFAF